MLKKPKILIPTDLSAASDLALRTANDICAKTNGEIHVVHALTYPFAWGSSAKIMNLFSQEFKKIILEENLDELKNQVERTKCNCTYEIIEGESEKELLRLIQQRGFDLVITSYKYSHISLVQNLIASSSVPLMVMKSDLKHEKIAALIDTVEPVESIFRISEELSEVFSSDLTYISICQDISALYGSIPTIAPIERYSFSVQEKALILDSMESYITSKVNKQIKSNTHVEITNELKVSDRLVKIMEEKSIDLAIMAAHHRGKIGRRVMGSVTRKILENFNGNILVIPLINEHRVE